jgi:hypothetical protein
VYHGREMARPPSRDRSAWPIRAYRLGSEPGDDLSASTTPEERLAMMWPLALEAWELAGRSLPAYPRAEAPVHLRPLRPPSHR